MKKFTLLIAFFSLTQIGTAQTSANLRENLASFDIGYLGTWLSYERQIGGNLSLNSRIGLEGVFFGGSGDFNYAFTPVISTEPRFYYNFNKRVAREKNTVNNSANYFAVEGKYVTDLFEITNDNVHANAGFILIPKWGMRRTIIGNLKFDLALGYGISLDKDAIGNQIWLDLGIGYVFL